MITVTDCTVVDQDQKAILSNVSAAFPPGALTLAIGKSSVGKSTLLRMIAGRLPRDLCHVGGEVWINDCGQVAWSLQDRQHAVAYVPQSLEVGDVTTHAWSQGRSASLAHACLSPTRVVICDEPTAGCDARLHAYWMDRLHHLAVSGHTVVVATSDAPRSLPWADWIVAIEPQDVISGSPESVCNKAKPNHADELNLPTLQREHAAKIYSVVQSFLNLDRQCIHVEQTVLPHHPFAEAITVLSVNSEQRATWLFQGCAFELSPFEIKQELLSYPRGHTYVASH
jgi:ABC-type Mn2+/Zn2+ transport system ATPase subunit